MQHWKLYASSPQQLLCMHSGVYLFLIKPPDNWPIVATCLRETVPPVSLSTNGLRRSNRQLRGWAEILRNHDGSSEHFSSTFHGNRGERRGAGASGSKCFGVEPSVPLFLYKLRAKYAYAYVELGYLDIGFARREREAIL